MTQNEIQFRDKHDSIIFKKAIKETLNVGDNVFYDAEEYKYQLPMRLEKIGYILRGEIKKKTIYLNDFGNFIVYEVIV